MGKKAISDIWTPGQIIDFQKEVTSGVTQHAVTAGAYTTITKTAGGPNVAISLTPSVNCWWEVRGRCYVQKIDAAYGYAYTRLLLNTADADGETFAASILAGLHNGVVQYATVVCDYAFKLAAGVAYTVSLQSYISFGSSQVYRDKGYTDLVAKAIVR